MSLHLARDLDVAQRTVLLAGEARTLAGALARKAGRHGQYRFRSPDEQRSAPEHITAIVFVAGIDTTAAARELAALPAMAESGTTPVYLVTGRPGVSADRSRPETQAADGSEPIAVLRDSGHPHVVLRTSTVIGDSSTGVIDDFGPLYRLVGALLWARRPRIPFRPDARIDMISCDVVADVVVRLLDNAVVGREYWLTGGPHALTVSQAVDELFDAARTAGLAEPGTSPSYQPMGEDRTRGLQPSRAGIVAGVLETSLGDRFENSLGELGSLGVSPLPQPRAALRASLDFWMATRVTRAA